MITAKNIERRLAILNYTKPNPDMDLLEGLMLDGRSRILSKSDEDLCPLSDKYFEFCLTQVGSFCTSSYNAVEIAMAIGIQPIYVAAAINLYGCEWAHRLLGLKRFAQLERDEHTVWKSAGAWFALGECAHRVLPLSEISPHQSTLRGAVLRGEMDIVRQIAETNPHRMMSILGVRKGPPYRDPRLEKSRQDKERAKAKAAEQGKAIAESRGRTEFGDMAPIFNGAITKPDRTRGLSDSSETRGTVNGRRFRV